MKRLVYPTLNPAGLMAATGTVYAATVMIYNATHHHGVIDPAVIVAAVGAVAALLTRQVVTPVADPRDGNGEPLLRASTISTVASAVAASGAAPSVSLSGEQMDAVREALAEASGRMEQTAGDERKVPPITISQMVPP